VAVLRFVVPDGWDGRRLDAFLRLEQHMSGSSIRRARRQPGGLTMDGLHIRTVDPLRAGAVIEVRLPDETNPCPADPTQVPVLYEDDSFWVFNKPAGMVCHPAAGSPGGTLANVCAALAPDLTCRLIGRLDRDTSGAVLVAKDAHAAYAVAGRIQKCYLALLCGTPGERRGVIDAPIGREGEHPARRCVCTDGKRAITRWRVLLEDGDYSLAAVWIETGRTHQIRVHMAHIGRPLAGDALYGGDTSLMYRQALHCYALRFSHPMTRARVSAAAPLPADLLGAITARFGRQPSLDGRISPEMAEGWDASWFC
jgi:23S rRNA pseudouridine1911/1915/1917 synthase